MVSKGLATVEVGGCYNFFLSLFSQVRLIL